MTVRTRYAPSPTGALHIGNVRSGLFAYLFARHNGGEFILRIDDTDLERSTEESLAEILESLRWLGMEWDKGPPDRRYFQSSRFDRYREGALQLLRHKKAYPCYCTAEELDAKRKQAEREHRKPGYDGKCRDLPFPADLPLPDKRAGRNYTIRFRSPRTGETVVEDQIKGRAVFDNAELDDLIIFRSDGVPTYNFATVLDDADFGITHVVRGDDHLPNTPRQMQIFFALGLKPPEYAHLPMVMGPDGQKLSKRHGATSVFAYRDAGYFPEALLNYLARLGWSHGDQEIFSKQELIEYFDFADCGKSAGIFNAEKLLWLNFHYMKERPLLQLAREVRPFIERAGYTQIPGDEAWLERMIATLPRARQDAGRAGRLREVLPERRDYDRSQGRGKVLEAGDSRAAQGPGGRVRIDRGRLQRGERPGGVRTRAGAVRDKARTTGAAGARGAYRWHSQPRDI